MKYLITGGAGFIGSHLVEAIVDHGGRVRVFDNFSTGKRRNIVSNPDAVEIVEGDIRDREAVRAAMVGISRIFHLAALVSVPESIARPELAFGVNVQGVQIVLDEARKAGAQRIVLASSAAVYGDNSNLPLSELESPKPLSPYGLDKWYAEQLGKLYQSLYHIEVTALRFFNVFGPRQDPESPYSGVISIFIRNMISRRQINIFGNGEQTRDFIYVKDVVAAMMLAMHKEASSFQILNVGRGVQVRINDLFQNLCVLLDYNKPAHYPASRRGEVVCSEANIAAISSLGYALEYTFEQGLANTIEWFRQEE